MKNKIIYFNGLYTNTLCNLTLQTVAFSARTSYIRRSKCLYCQKANFLALHSAYRFGFSVIAVLSFTRLELFLEDGLQDRKQAKHC